MRNLKQEFVADVVYRAVQELDKLDNFTLDKEVQEVATKAASQQFDEIANKAQAKLDQLSNNPTLDDKNKVSLELRKEVTQMAVNQNKVAEAAIEEFLEPSVQFLDQKDKPVASKEEKNDLIREIVSKKMLEAIRDHKSTSLADLAISERMKATPKLSEERRQSISRSSMSSPKTKRRFSFRKQEDAKPPNWATDNIAIAKNAAAEGKKEAAKNVDSPKVAKK